MKSSLASRGTIPLLASAALVSLVFVSAAKAQQPIKIGIPTSLSGPFSAAGIDNKRIAEFVAAEANAKGGVLGRKIQIKALDTEGKPELARLQAEKLTLDGYKILIGTTMSGEGLAMLPMLQRWDALYISTINKADALTNEACVPRFFRVNRPDYADITLVKPWLAKRKEKKWAILAGDIAWGRGSGANFKAAANSLGREIVSENYAPFGANDYAPYIQQIKDSGAEGMWVALTGAGGFAFIQQAKQFGLLDKVVTAGANLATPAHVDALGDLTKGIWGIINYSSTLNTPENQAFVAAWKKANKGEEPNNYMGEAYVAWQVLLQAIAKAKSDKPVDLVKAMEGSVFDTILGKLRMRVEDHQLVAPDYFGYIGEQGGKLRPIITMSVPAEEATPPQGKCKMPKL